MFTKLRRSRVIVVIETHQIANFMLCLRHFLLFIMFEQTSVNNIMLISYSSAQQYVFETILCKIK